MRDGERVGAVRPGEDLERQGRVLHRPDEDSHVVIAPGQRDDAGGADPAMGGLEAHHPQ
jgi:hypothetical protein